VAAAAEHVDRALDFCDRALDHLKSEEPNVGEAIPLIEATRTELLALQKSPESSRKPDGDAVGQEPRTVRAAARDA
jgi:hypothetical protein